MATVEYSQSLVQALQEELTATFGLRSLRLSRQPPNSGNVFPVELVDGSSIAHLDNSEVQEVMEITSVGRSDTFYLGFVAWFEFFDKKQYILKSVSLTVFHRVVDELVPMFRAEWDRAHADDEKTFHAQPHWHFVQSPERIERIVRASLKPIGEVLEFSPHPQGPRLFSRIADCRKFHFAMTSLWEKSDVTPPKRVFSSGDFRKWFFGLTKYIAGQLKFLADKMPSSDPHVFSQRDTIEGAAE